MKQFKKAIGIISVLLLLGTSNAVMAAEEIKIIKSGNIEYRTHVQNEGWQEWKGEGEQSGTYGQSLRLEGIEIKVTNLPDKTHQVGVQYKTHVQNIGWQDWVEDGETSGTEGLGYRLEAIQIELTGADADKYDVYYCVHAQNIGTLGWAKNGESSGTAGYGYRLEAIELQLKQKSEAAPLSYSRKAFYNYSVDGFSFMPTGDGNWQEGDSTGATGKPIFGDK